MINTIRYLNELAGEYNITEVSSLSLRTQLLI
jgi:hypothetical protein